jgi:hypothetical protein
MYNFSPLSSRSNEVEIDYKQKPIPTLTFWSYNFRAVITPINSYSTTQHAATEIPTTQKSTCTHLESRYYLILASAPKKALEVRNILPRQAATATDAHSSTLFSSPSLSIAVDTYQSPSSSHNPHKRQSSSSRVNIKGSASRMRWLDE